MCHDIILPSPSSSFCSSFLLTFRICRTPVSDMTIMCVSCVCHVTQVTPPPSWRLPREAMLTLSDYSSTMEQTSMPSRGNRCIVLCEWPVQLVPGMFNGLRVHAHTIHMHVVRTYMYIHTCTSSCDLTCLQSFTSRQPSVGCDLKVCSSHAFSRHRILLCMTVYMYVQYLYG